MVVSDRVEIEFIAKDEVSKVLKSIQGDMDKLAKITEKSGEKSEKSFLDLGQVASSALGFTLAGAVSKATDAVVQFSKESVQSFMALERQMQGLEVQTGHTADALLNDLSQATDGLVDKLSLAKGASRALALGLEKDTLPELARTAVALGKIQGLKPEQAFNDLVTGIGRASPMILDNLGITLDAEKAYKEWALANDRVVESMSKLERTAAINNAVIQNSKYIVMAMEVQMTTMADRMDKARTAVSDFKNTWGEMLLSPIQLTIMTTTAEGIASISDEFKEAQTVINLYADAIISLNEDQKSLNSSLNETVAKMTELMQGGLTEDQEVLQNSLNKQKLEELRLQKEINDLQSSVTMTQGGFQINDPDRYRQLAEKQAQLKTLQMEQKDTQLEYNILLAEQKVLLDEAEPTYEKISGTTDTIAKSNADLLLKLEEQQLNYQTIKLSIEQNELAIKKNGERLQEVKDVQDQIVASVERELELRRQMSGVGTQMSFGRGLSPGPNISDEAG